MPDNKSLQFNINSLFYLAPVMYSLISELDMYFSNIHTLYHKIKSIFKTNIYMNCHTFTYYFTVYPALLISYYFPMIFFDNEMSQYINSYAYDLTYNMYFTK